MLISLTAAYQPEQGLLCVAFRALCFLALLQARMTIGYWSPPVRKQRLRPSHWEGRQASSSRLEPSKLEASIICATCPDKSSGPRK